MCDGVCDDAVSVMDWGGGQPGRVKREGCAGKCSFTMFTIIGIIMFDVMETVQGSRLRACREQ